MAKEYKYKEDKVDIKNIIIDSNEKYRYYLYIPLKNTNSKKVLVVLKNPSKANSQKSDRTINNVIDFCFKKYGGIYIMNLFPYYSTDSAKLKEFIKSNTFNKHMRKNKKVLITMLSKVDDVIIAWGTGNKIGNKKAYDNAINCALNIFKNSNVQPYAIKVKGTQISLYPLHAQNWHSKQKFEVYKWI